MRAINTEASLVWEDHSLHRSPRSALHMRCEVISISGFVGFTTYESWTLEVAPVVAFSFVPKHYRRHYSQSVGEELPGDPPRNYCPCGKTWDELVDSWTGYSVEDRDEKMYRLCL